MVRDAVSTIVIFFNCNSQFDITLLNHKLMWIVIKDAQNKEGRTLKVPWHCHSAIKGSNVLRRFIKLTKIRQIHFAPTFMFSVQTV